MRFSLALLATLAAASSFIGTAKADQYKWCAEYGNGSRNCGFITLNQCRATIAGDNRGTCVINGFADNRWERRPFVR